MATLFKGKKAVDKQKLRGGYYTPPVLADFLCAWAIRDKNQSVLEPSCGDGNFVVAALNNTNSKANYSINLTAVEIDNVEFDKAQSRSLEYQKNSSIKWVNEDFFRAYGALKNIKFDAVIGNPPFIRFQYFDDESRDIAFDHLRDAGYKPTKLANCWAAFVQLSIELLSSNGRLAMVIPAELLQVKYAGELRERITQSFDHIILVTFKTLVFKDIQQEVVLLLAEGKREHIGGESDIHTIDIENEHMLDVSLFEETIAHSKAKHSRKGLKWTSLFLTEEQFKAIDSAQKSSKITHLGDIASVDVGIVTGRNSFFVVTDETKNNFELSEYTVPLVGKTNALKSLSFTKKDFKKFKDENPAYLLKLKEIDEINFNSKLKEYIALGESEDVHKGYKCRIRKRWYDVPSTHISDGFLFRQIHKYPLLVHNGANATCTDTIHRVRLLDDNIDFKLLSASFVNSLTFAWAEVCGRSYGGGVLELEPNESEELPIPYFPNVSLDFEFVDKCIESGDINRALDYVDEILLIGELGFSKRRVSLLRKSWESLRNRRIMRK